MAFPKTSRVVYKKNTLKTVVCQLRFPSILRIDAEIPARFQEYVRGTYPIFRERIENNIPFPVELESLFQKQIRDSLSGGRKVYDFISSDEKSIITLTRDYISLTSNNYSRWRDFKEGFRPAIDGFNKIYTPSFYLRIGLRYQNIIVRSELNLGNTKWPEILQPYILGVLSNDDVSNSVNSSLQIVEISLENNLGQVRLQTGLVYSESNPEIGYLIDSDIFSEERMEVDNALQRLDEFNKAGTYLYNWCITDRLREAMGPKHI